MATLRDWLQLFRSHTSPLEMIITIAGSALAVGTVWDVKVLLFLIFGWLYHNGGYGHNSAEDFIQGFDRDDPHKSHHPLQRGVLDPYLARGTCILLIMVSFFYGAIISGFALLPLAVLILLTGMGFLYNIFGKRIGSKFIPIAIAHSLLLPFAYFGSGGVLELQEGFPYVTNDLGAVMLIAFLYLVFQIIYQIMVEGDLKDIDMDEASFLKTLGVWVEDGEFRSSPTARSFSLIIKSASIAGLFWILIILEAEAWYYLALIILSLAMVVQDHRLMGSRKWDHGRCVKDMALMEVLSTFALLLSFSSVAGGWTAFLVVVLINIGYFVMMNRFLWGTLMKPKV
ncbi:MAG: UbiA family prenyltransferase [Thermoplasmatota archaeon]